MATNDSRPLPDLTADQLVKFLSKIDQRGPDQCWPWTGNRFQKQGTSEGYGRFTIWDAERNRPRGIKAHRMAYKLATGEDPGPALVCHHCDNPPCCNPTHFFLGTILDNSRDMTVKGRAASGDRNGMRLHPESVLRGDAHWTRQKPECLMHGSNHWTNQHLERISGERNPAAKLTWEIVREIRRRAASGESGAALAREFGVTKPTACRIIRGENWHEGHLAIQPVLVAAPDSFT